MPMGRCRKLLRLAYKFPWEKNFRIIQRIKNQARRSFSSIKTSPSINDCLIDWLICYFIHHTIDCLIDWLIHYFTHYTIDCLIDWFVISPITLLIDCLIDWLITYLRSRIIIDIDDFIQIPGDNFGDFLELDKVELLIGDEHVERDGRQIAHSSLHRWEKRAMRKMAFLKTFQIWKLFFHAKSKKSNKKKKLKKEN